MCGLSPTPLVVQMVFSRVLTRFCHLNYITTSSIGKRITGWSVNRNVA
jgi:hypothetical protein